MIVTVKKLITDVFLSKAVPWLVIASLALLPVGRAAELPLILLALIGLKVLVSTIKDRNWEKSTVCFILFFLCLWIPILISLPDSYNFGKTFSSSLEYLRFLLSGMAVLKYCAHSKGMRLITTCTLGIVSFWIFDALFQYFRGADIFGQPYIHVPLRLNGVFGDKLYLGPFLALYSAFFLVTLLKWKYLALSSVVNVLCLLVLLLAGSRAGWLSYLVALLLFLAYSCRNNLKMFIIGIALLSACSMTAVTVVYNLSENFAQRVDSTLLIFKGDEKSIDQALSFRLPIWKTALSMISAHPINGVGGRAFRYAYPDYAAADDRYLADDETNPDLRIGALHAHHIVLEVLSETGVLGGCFFVGAMAVLAWYWRSGNECRNSLMLPYALAIAAIFFPINTHLSLYSSVFSQVIYWFISLFFTAGAIPCSSPERQRP